jgi:CDP-glucose 4,6-dehydratase
VRNLSKSFWPGKRVLVTGHTGFKGAWLSIWLDNLGAKVSGLSLAPDSTSLFVQANVERHINHFEADIRSKDAVRSVFDLVNPEIVIHMAAQALVRSSYVDPIETYEANVLGTAHILESARYQKDLKAMVIVTSDKCYENNEWHWRYREIDTLGGHDPYSSSKACAEILTQSFIRSFFVGTGLSVATARAGNVIGGGDWAVDRLVPDLVRASINRTPISIRHPKAVRPWQHVLEPLSGYLTLAESLYNSPEKLSNAYNFGPREDERKSVKDLVDFFTSNFDSSIAVQYDQGPRPHEANTLRLDISLVTAQLGWNPRWPVKKALDMTVYWYRKWLLGENMNTLCAAQIHEYEETEIEK